MADTMSKVPWDRLQTGTDTEQALGRMAMPVKAMPENDYPEREVPKHEEPAPFVFTSSPSGGK